MRLPPEPQSMLSFGGYFELLRATFQMPRDVAARLIGMGLPRAVLWQAMLLVMVLSALLAEIGLFVMAGAGDLPDAAAIGMPVALAVIQMGFLVLLAGAIARVGRHYGGGGDFDGALTIVIWLQAVFLAVQGAQILLSLIGFSLIAGLLGAVSFPVFFWLLTQFIMALHGFGGPWKVFFTLIMGLIGVVFLVSALLTSMGFGPALQG